MSRNGLLIRGSKINRPKAGAFGRLTLKVIVLVFPLVSFGNGKDKAQKFHQTVLGYTEPTITGSPICGVVTSKLTSVAFLVSR